MCKTQGDNEYSYTLYALERENYIFSGIYTPNSSPLIYHILEIHDMLCKKKKKRFILRRKLLNVDAKENKF